MKGLVFEGLRGGSLNPGSLLATDRSKAMVLCVMLNKCFWSRCFVS